MTSELVLTCVLILLATLLALIILWMSHVEKTLAILVDLARRDDGDPGEYDPHSLPVMAGFPRTNAREMAAPGGGPGKLPDRERVGGPHEVPSVMPANPGSFPGYPVD